MTCLASDLSQIDLGEVRCHLSLACEAPQCTKQRMGDAPGHTIVEEFDPVSRDPPAARSVGFGSPIGSGCVPMDVGVYPM